MHSRTKYDFIICGTGAAGLSFVYHLLKSSLGKSRILLIDKEVKTKDDRTWCYWSEKPFPFENSHRSSWNQIEIKWDGNSLKKSTGTSSYFEISSKLFYEEIYKIINRHKNVDIVIDEVLKIEPRINRANVTTLNNEYEGVHVINSIPDLLQKTPDSYSLTQNFMGWRIEVKNGSFDPTTVVLMDFYKKNSSDFFYILPYSKNEALVEYTRISPNIPEREFYEQKLKEYLSKRYHISDFTIQHKEFGVIPMSNFEYLHGNQANIFQIGTVGGDTRSTSGYTFKYIQTHCIQILKSIQEGHPHVKKSRKHSFYDWLLLNVIIKKPFLLGVIFYRLFRYTPLKIIFKFLDAKTTIWEDLRVIMSLPKTPFLLALFQRKKQLYEISEKDSHSDHLRRAV